MKVQKCFAYTYKWILKQKCNLLKSNYIQSNHIKSIQAYLVDGIVN